MDRRQFLATCSATVFATFAARSLGISQVLFPDGFVTWRAGDPYFKEGPAPRPEITAVVDVVVPPDPDIPGDFKGSDYNADWVVASMLGSAGQLAASAMLNKYAKQVAGAKFVECTPEEQMTALKQWIIEREDYSSTINEMLTGVITLSMIGTYEDNDKTDENILFESMGWYDPMDPANSFRLPCEGYPDARMFPVRLRKGLRE